MAAPFVWFDLITGEGLAGADGISAFYRALFGWSIGPGMGDYESWMTDGDQPWAGILSGETGSPGRWVPYVPVRNLDAAVKQARTLGGTVVRDKAAGPAGTSVLVADPGGAVVALFTPAAG